MRYLVPGFLVAASGILLGCTERPQESAPKTTPPVAEKKEAEEEQKIHKALAKLSPEDRTLAEKQRFCVIETDNRLGEMGKPIKLDVKGRAVFLCCKSCQKEALADPDKTLAQLDKLTQPEKK